MNESSNTRFLYLDSARGIAAMSVVVWHFIAAFVMSQSDTILKSPLHFFWYGEADVVFFFVHSGFILSYAYANVQSKLTPASYIRFLIERIFRIYPLFILILCISFFLQKHLFSLPHTVYVSAKFHAFWQANFGWRDLLRNCLLIFSVSQRSAALLPQDWTLAVEVLIGPFVPLLAYVLRKIKWVWFYWLMVAILLFIARINTFLFEFALGTFIFFKWQTIRNTWNAVHLVARIVAVLLAVFLYTCFFHFSSLFDTEKVLFRPGVDRLFVALGCGLFFCVIISSKRMQQIMSFPLLVRIGKACYSLYLWHMMFLICFADFYWTGLAEIGVHRSGPQLVVFFSIYLLINLILSQVSYRYVEIPFNMLGKRIGRRVENLLNSITLQHGDIPANIE